MRGVWSGTFWGIALVVLGVLLLLKLFLHVDLPIFRIAFALLLIWLGIRVLVGGSSAPFAGRSVVFGEGRLEGRGKDEYTVVFGKGVVDLAGIVPETQDVPVEVTTVFGSASLIVPKEVPVRVEVNSAFAGARLPDGSQVAFGTHTWRNAAWKEGVPCLDVDVNVVFGGVDVVEK